MSETNNQEFSIQRVLVKDLSFEAPTSPEIFKDEWKPEIDLNLDYENKKLDDHFYAVTLSVTATTKLGEKTAFIAEVKQMGLFMIKGFEGEQLDELLGSFCPNILFPYARETISEMVNRGGFPPLYLAPINFDAIYQQRKQEAAQQAATADS